MLLLASLACVPTAVYGIRLDGSMPRNTEVSVVGGVFPEFAEDGSDASVAGLSGDRGQRLRRLRRRSRDRHRHRDVGDDGAGRRKLQGGRSAYPSLSIRAHGSTQNPLVTASAQRMRKTSRPRTPEARSVA